MREENELYKAKLIMKLYEVTLLVTERMIDWYDPYDQLLELENAIIKYKVN